jgi:hypothetical protein
VSSNSSFELILHTGHSLLKKRLEIACNPWKGKKPDAGIIFFRN